MNDIRRTVCLFLNGRTTSAMDVVKVESAKNGRSGSIREHQLCITQASSSFMYFISFSTPKQSQDFLRDYNQKVVDTSIWYVVRMPPSLVPKKYLKSTKTDTF